MGRQPENETVLYRQETILLDASRSAGGQEDAREKAGREKSSSVSVSDLSLLARRKCSRSSAVTEHFTRNAVSAELAELREKLSALPLWERARILGAVAKKTGEPIYEIERSLREDNEP
jgi:hypothetical protein